MGIEYVYFEIHKAKIARPEECTSFQFIENPDSVVKKKMCREMQALVTTVCTVKQHVKKMTIVPNYNLDKSIN